MFLKKLLQKMKQERGAIIVFTAVLLPLMLGFAGLGFDVGNLYIHKARLQNVADAAALAGAREYIDSQKYYVKDEADSGSAAGGVITYSENTLPASRGGNHPNADEAADQYIYKNVVNLHNTVQSDTSSHLALKSDNGEKLFYRIGLNEQVQLHFLPVLLGGAKEQTVSAEAIALIEPGTTEVNTVAGAQKYSIFENLFTYSGYFYSGLSNEAPADASGNKLKDTITTLFVGPLAYTFGNGSGAVEDSSIDNGNSFYNIDEILAGHYEHLFQEYGNFNPSIAPNNLTNNRWSIVNDPTIRTISNTTAYIDAFKEWLKKPHLVIKNNEMLTLTHKGNFDFDNLKTDDGQNTNVIYFDKTNSGELTININTKIAQAADSSPIYVLIEDTVKLKEINSTVEDDTTLGQNAPPSNHTPGRPLIIVYYGTNGFDLNIGFDKDGNASAKRCVFDGVVYSPYTNIVNVYLNGSFYGNIVAPGISVTSNSRSKSVFSQKNYLESGNYTDQYVAAVTNQIAVNAQSSLPPEGFMDSIVRVYLETINFDYDMYKKLSKKGTFYNVLSYEQKMAMYAKWLQLRDDPNYAAYKDFLWPFGNESLYEPESGSSSSSSQTTTDYASGTLRLINTRTEYTTDNPFRSL